MRPNRGILGRKEAEEQAFQMEGPARGRGKVIVLGKQMSFSMVGAEGAWGGVAGSQLEKWGPGDRGRVKAQAFSRCDQGPLPPIT